MLLSEQERKAYADGWRDALAALDAATARGSWLWYLLRPAVAAHVVKLDNWASSGSSLFVPVVTLKESRSGFGYESRDEE